MDIFEFAAMIEETPVRSRVIEYHQSSDATDNHTNRNRLAAVCLTDVLSDGLSLVYSFFEPDLEKKSLGTYMILDHIEIARETGLPYVYLGYWVPGSPKMGYKAGFSSLEIHKGGNWLDLGNPEDHTQETDPLSVAPIAEQVARIRLPDGRSPRTKS